MNPDWSLIALGNAIFAIPIAIAALLAERRARNPSIAHALWVLTLLRLLAPPIISVPIPSDWMPAPRTASIQETPPVESWNSDAARPVSAKRSPTPVAVVLATPEPTEPLGQTAFPFISTLHPLWVLWALGSLSVMLTSLVLALRFE